ncbi:hypothetical protein [Aneurinibacillus migulanus]|uniref:hypothetical protein n=1 Tax=Aneurinibacillus migulanus TaxID=47500 RepID=UPI001F29B3B8|nr:hypothetical protein [Aneurinibacillus migulanus]
MIHRQILVVRGKKRRKSGGRSGWKKARLPFFCWSVGRIQSSSFSESPPSNHAIVSKYQV